MHNVLSPPLSDEQPVPRGGVLEELSQVPLNELAAHPYTEMVLSRMLRKDTPEVEPVRVAAFNSHI